MLCVRSREVGWRHGSHDDNNYGHRPTVQGGTTIFMYIFISNSYT